MGWEVCISSPVLKNPLFEKVCFSHPVSIKRRWCHIPMYDYGLCVLMSNCSKYLNSNRCWVYSSHSSLCQQLNLGNQRWFLEPLLCNQGCGEMWGEHRKPGEAFQWPRKCFLEELLIQGCYISTTGVFQGNQRFVFGATKVFLGSYTASHLYAICQEFKFYVFVIYFIVIKEKCFGLCHCFCVSELLFIKQFVWASTLTWLVLFFQFEVQKLRIYCDPEQNNRETACEIPGFVSRMDYFFHRVLLQYFQSNK